MTRWTSSRVRTPKLALLFLPFLVLSRASGQNAEDPKEIMDRVDRMLRGDSSHGKVAMKVVAKHWERTLTLEIWSEGTEKALIRILEPKKEAGTATLKVGPDIWNYLPKIDRTIRVPSSMMMGSWMGSHFTNDDLVKETRLIRDYDIQLSYKGDRQGVEVYEFTLVPVPDAPVVWGKIVYEVRIEDLMPVWARYYGDDGELKRTMTFHDYKKMGERLVPAQMKLTPTDKPDEYTQMIYESLEFDIPIPERMFSLSELRR